MELYRKTAAELSALLRAGEVSACEVLEDTLARIRTVEPQIHAFLTLAEDTARAQARAVDEKRAKGEPLGALAGIPVGIKDNICTKGLKTTCASRMLENFVPPYNATVIEKLLAADAVLPGKLNMDEFAMGGSSETSAFGCTKNPWDTAHIPGGSSGGSAASVAACEAPLSLGTDTGGSIRCPAAFCGVVGLRPTYGAVSRFGLVAMASSLDQIGPLARTVDDAALLFRAICGEDAAHDATSRSCPAPELPPDVKGLRIGLLRECFSAGIHAQSRMAALTAAETLRALGARTEEVSVPAAAQALPIYQVLSSAEAASNLARFDGIRYGRAPQGTGTLASRCRAARTEGFGPEVQRRILFGAYLLSSGGQEDYRRAKMCQRGLQQALTQAFETCDVLITPTTPAPAERLGEKRPGQCSADFCTVAASLAGLPALSVPCGFSAEGLPLGVQLIGPKGSEARLFRAAKAYETAVGGFAVKEL